MELNGLPDNEIAALTREILPLFIQQEIERAKSKQLNNKQMESVLRTIGAFVDDLIEESVSTFGQMCRMWRRKCDEVEYYIEQFGEVEIPEGWEPASRWFGTCDVCDVSYELGSDDHCGECGCCKEHCSC